jgi:hypothetical protein
MNLKLLTAISIAALPFLAGCNNAKPPATVANDVATAQESAAVKVTEARKDASTEDAKAADKVNDKLDDLRNTEAKGAYEVALAKAEGAHKVALEKCEAKSGDAQKKCKDRADSDFAAAKANSKASELAAKP